MESPRAPRTKRRAQPPHAHSETANVASVPPRELLAVEAGVPFPAAAPAEAEHPGQGLVAAQLGRRQPPLAVLPADGGTGRASYGSGAQTGRCAPGLVVPVPKEESARPGAGERGTSRHSPGSRR